MKKIAILLASLGLMLTGCSSQEASLDETQTPPSNEENNNENNKEENDDSEEDSEGNSGDNTGDENDDKENDSENNETEENPQDLETERTFSLHLNYNKDGYIITNYFGELENVVVPNTYKDLPIVEIDNEVFKYDEFLKSISIPNSVRKIGVEAFYYCENLETVTIEDNSQLSKIRYRTFSNCSNLKTVDLGQNPALTTIEARAFYECKSLSAFYLSKKVLYIGEHVFSFCENLTMYCESLEPLSGRDQTWFKDDVERPSQYQKIVRGYVGISSNYNGLEYSVKINEEGDKVIILTGYSGTDTELYIPEYIKVGDEELLVSEILRYAFFNVETFDYIHIPETIAIIGYKAIRVNEIVFCETADKTGWESEWCYRGVVITNTYLGIHGYLNGFYYAAKKDENGEPFIVVIGLGEEREVIIPETINVNGVDAPVREIRRLSSNIVETIILPHTITKIENNTFSYVYSLTTLFFPNSVTELGSNAFDNHGQDLILYTDYKSRPSNWHSSVYCGRLVVYSSYFGVNGNYNGLNYALCVDDNNEKYINIARYIGTDNEVVIPESINVDGEEIPVKLIYGNAFREGFDNKITSVTIPSSLTKISFQAFEYCQNLKEVIIKGDSNLNIIDDNAFSGCLSLETIFIPSSVTTFGYGVFGECNNLTIYCELSESETTRESYWNSDCDVVWDTTYEEYLEVINNDESLTK